MPDTLHQEIASFLNAVQAINGSYYDAVRGFSLNHQSLVDTQREQIEILKHKKPEHASVEFWDAQDVMYADGFPEDPRFTPLHKTKMSHFKKRNDVEGENTKLIARLCLVSIYHIWDEAFRPKIAAFVGRDSKSIISPVMGDLRRIRNSIIHGKGIAQPDIIKCQVLKWFSDGDEIMITQPKFREMIVEIVRGMDSLYEDLITIKA